MGGVASPIARKKKRPPLGFETLEDRTAPALLNWTGMGGDNLWENPANWDTNTNAVPTINDDVNIMMATNPIVNQQGAAAAGTLSNMSGVDLVIHDSLTIGQSADFASRLIVDGTLTANAGAYLTTMTGFDLSGQVHLGAGSQLSIMGSATLSGSQIDGDGLVTFWSGTQSLSGTVSIHNLNLSGGTLQGPGTLTITGTMNWQGGDVGNYGGAVTINGGAFIISGAGNWHGGLVRTGDVTVNAGLYVSVDALDLTGAAHLGAGSQLALTMGTSTLRSGAVIDGAGVLAFGMSNTLSIPGSATIQNLNFSGGMLQGPGTLTITGTMNWDGGELASPVGTLNIANSPNRATLNINYGMKTINGWTVNVDGVANWTGGDVDNADSTLNIGAAGVFNITSGGTWRDTYYDGLSTIKNAGTLNSTNSNTKWIEAAFNNTGTANVSGGDLVLSNGGVFAGDINTDQVAYTVLANGQFFVQVPNIPQVQRFGNLRVGPINAGGGIAVLNLGNAQTTSQLNRLHLRAGGRITGSGTVEVQIAFRWSSISSMDTAVGNPPGKLVALAGCTTTLDLRQGDDGSDAAWMENFEFWNEGLLYCDGGRDLTITLWDNAEIFNSGRFEISGRYAGGQLYISHANNFVGPGGSFTNLPGGEIVVNGDADVQTNLITFGVYLRQFYNSGAITLVNANVRFAEGDDWISSGYIDADSDSAVIFNAGTYSFQSNVPFEDLNALRGNGRYIFGDAANVIIPSSSGTVSATNVEMWALSRIAGAGNLAVNNLVWQNNAMMQSAWAGQSGTGTTTIKAGGTLRIYGSVSLKQRTLVVQGSAQWNAGEQFGIEGSSQIIIDGGTFDILANADNAMTDVDNGNGRIIVRNNGLFRKGVTEAPYVTSINLFFTNESGRVQADGVVQWQFNGAFFSQTGASAVTVLGWFDYNLSSATFTGGTIQLDGGSLVLTNNTDRLSDVTLRLAGTVSGFSARRSTIFLTGTLNATDAVVLIGSSALHLAGNQLNVTGTIILPASCFIFLEGGTITTTQAFSPDENRVDAPGTINGVYYGGN